MPKSPKRVPGTKNGRTRDRILDKAEILFARKGYHGVSVREITNAADCNLAAVNYHFGKKQNLYLEVFRSRWLPRAAQVNATFRRTLKSNGDMTPSAVIQSLAGHGGQGQQPGMAQGQNPGGRGMGQGLAQPAGFMDHIGKCFDAGIIKAGILRIRYH
mgnify:CR=1 FL=1